MREKEDNKSKSKKDEASPETLMEGIGKMFAIIMLLLRGMAILVICYFLHYFISTYVLT